MAAGPEGVPGVCGGGEGSETPGTPPDALTERPRVRRHRGRFLVWAPRAARALRERHRVWGALVGTPPRRGRAGAGAAGPRLPLELSPEEARALRESGGATVEPVDEAEAEPEETPPGPPSLFHAGAVALCPCSSQAQPLGALLAAARLGTSVRKSLLLCSAPPGGAMAVTALTWRADLT
ncbi:tRNA-splicing endonuclease subunit Sen34 isoform X2 [Camarhynchus parvulus]|uniref:tRNA-splicing endonuclease subunit Sen34 isoform X2 n=1 Tax=Geospiza parvula TaxID=87175 RepID=UPI001237A676|nr:tRNA-splicing endonuclease subunit Sen34 isoform X2 [Camarhynchus parvulus]